MLPIWQKSKPQWLRANTSAIRSSKPKVPNQKQTHKAQITLVHIYIHTWTNTQKNSNTQTHGQTTINTNTNATQPREILQEEKKVRERNWVGLFNIVIWKPKEAKLEIYVWERERNWVRGSTNLSNISSLCRIRKLHIHSLLNCTQEFLPGFCRNNKVIWSMKSAQVT